MKPVDLQIIGHELAIKWPDQTEHFISCETLRRFCPCAACMGEKDIFENLYRPPDRPFGSNAFDLVRLTPVGAYAVQPVWGDGHGSGIYTWDWLQRIATSTES